MVDAENFVYASCVVCQPVSEATSNCQLHLEPEGFSRHSAASAAGRVLLLGQCLQACSEILSGSAQHTVAAGVLCKSWKGIKVPCSPTARAHSPLLGSLWRHALEMMLPHGFPQPHRE